MQPNTLADLTIRSPKLHTGSNRWYRYYAGFDRGFVDDVIRELFADQAGMEILDPWMGSGTALSAAASRGHHVHGIDLNPAMIVVAKGRLLSQDTIESVAALTRDILAKWVGGTEIGESEPLTQWFDSQSSALIRGGAMVIDTLLSEPSHSTDQKVGGMSSLAALFTVALFESVGQFLRSYASLNPTWIKRSELGAGQVSVNLDSIKEKFKESVERLAAHITAHGALDQATRDQATISLGDSRSVALDDSVIAATISSPPYLTRLDYVIGHLPELAVLGVGPTEIDELRRKMIGTPTIDKSVSTHTLGPLTNALIASIEAHDSYAAKAYYAPNFKQYFYGMAESISEISRVSKPNGDVLLVVQDSWFKGIHIDLADCLVDIAALSGWEQVGKLDFPSARSMLSINPKANSAAKVNKPVESLVHLRR